MDIAKYEIQKKMGEYAREIDSVISDYHSVNTNEREKKRLEEYLNIMNAKYTTLSTLFETIYGEYPLFGNVKQRRYI